MSMVIKNRRGDVVAELEGPLISAHFDSRDLSEAVFEGLNLEGAYFSGTNLRRASFREASLYWCDFFQANLEEADFTRADLRGADLKHANLRHSDLREANLGRDNLGGATSLHGADLTGACMKSTILHGAEYDSRTTFPTGFNPSQCGMIIRLWKE